MCAGSFGNNTEAPTKEENYLLDWSCVVRFGHIGSCPFFENAVGGYPVLSIQLFRALAQRCNCVNFPPPSDHNL